jgi:hypothetical protein
MVALLYGSIPFLAGAGLLALAVSLLSRVSSGPRRWPVTRRAFVVGCSGLALASLVFIVATIVSSVGATPIGAAGADGPVAASRLSSVAPAGFRDGLPRTSCGDITLGQGERIPAAAVECIDSAIGRSDAELAVLSPTTEGDPIVTFYRTVPPAGGIEIYTDATQDNFGPKTWAHQSCPTATSVTSLRNCVED